MKKIINWFRDDNDDENMEEAVIRDEPILPINSEKRELSRKVEARVAYEYPKGQFRFPLIPDDPKPVLHKRVIEEKRHEEVQKSHVAEPSLKKEKQVVRETERKNSRPFRPTAIPSPIYGFYRRPIKEDPPKIVYEINSFEQSTEYLENLQTNAIDESSAQTDTIIKSEKEKQNEIEIEQPEIKADGTIEIEHFEIERGGEIEAQQPETKTDSEIETAQPELKTNYAEEIQQFELNISSEEIEQTEIKASEMHVDQLEPKSMEIEAVSFIEEETIYLPDDHVLQMEESVEETEIAKVALHMLETQNNNEKNEQEHDQLAHNKEEAKQKQEKRRSHLPFNVIMLSQDKRKLAQKNMMTAKAEVSATIHQKNEPEQNTQVEEEQKNDLIHYAFPSFDLLQPPIIVEEVGEWLNEQRNLLNITLKNFNVGAEVVNVTQGPSVTRFEVQPEPGVKVNKITNLSDDIKLSLAAKDIRIEAPIPGKHTIGIEVPNQASRPVLISEIINSPEFKNSVSPLTAALGLDISGKPIVTDLRKMPHGLIAGATGSGKSVCINTILVSLLYKATPDELKLLLIDPKMVELAPYNRIPHLVSPVITDVKAATAALKWAVEEMERRYELFAHTGVRDINRFNELAEAHKQYTDKLPYIVIIIDELADLMMMSPADVEEAICRIAQKARACGIHLIIATQRPSVDVITGLIKANVPTRIAFSVSSQVDSRTIIDISGAEKLLGKGDMLFWENGTSKPVRIQGTFVSDEEIDEVVKHVRLEREPSYLFEQEDLMKKAAVTEEEDELFFEACEYVVEHGGASTSLLQRRFKIGYNRAARLIDLMEHQGFISESRGSKPRDVLMTLADLETLQE